MIGRGCTVGSNVKLRGCYLWDNCTVGDGAELESVIMANNAGVGSNAKAGKGCILSYGTSLGDDHILPPYTIISTKCDPDEDEEWDDLDKPTGAPSSQNDAWSAKEVGKGGVGRVYVWRQDRSARYIHPRLNSISPDLTAKGKDDKEEKKEERKSQDVVRAHSLSSQEDKIESLLREVNDTISRGEKENLEISSIVLEAGTLKLSHDAQLADFSWAVCVALFHLINPPAEPGKRLLNSTVKDLQRVFGKWKGILLKFRSDAEDEQKKILFGLEKACKHRSEFKLYFMWALNSLYDDDILESEVIMSWAGLRENADDVDHKYFWQSSKQFIQYVRVQALEEDSDEEEESEEESGDS